MQFRKSNENIHGKVINRNRICKSKIYARARPQGV